LILKALKPWHIKGALWELGCGTGNVGHFLKNHSYDIVGIEPSPVAAELSSKKGILTLRGAIQDFELPKKSLNGIGPFDILEHLDERTEFLKYLHDLLSPEGILVVTVPASQLLWSQSDVLAGHKLRYTSRVLKTDLTNAGFKILYMKKMFAPPFFRFY